MYCQATVVCKTGYHLAITKHPFDPASSNPSQLFLVPDHRRVPPLTSTKATLKFFGAGSPAWDGSESRHRLGPTAIPSNYLKPHRRTPPPTYQSTPGRVGSGGQSDGLGGVAGTTTSKGVPGQPSVGSDVQGNYEEPEDIENGGPSGAASGAVPGKNVASGAQSRASTSHGDRGRSNQPGKYADGRGRGENVTNDQYQGDGQGGEEDGSTERDSAEANPYSTVGNTTQCQSDRLFHPPLVCLPDLCNSRAPPEHGYVLPPGKVPVGRRVSLGCDPGYVLWGDDHVLDGIGRPADPDPSDPLEMWTHDMWLARPLCLPNRQFTPGAVCVPSCGAHPPVEHATVIPSQPFTPIIPSQPFKPRFLYLFSILI